MASANYAIRMLILGRNCVNHALKVKEIINKLDIGFASNATLRTKTTELIIAIAVREQCDYYDI